MPLLFSAPTGGGSPRSAKEFHGWEPLVSCERGFDASVEPMTHAEMDHLCGKNILLLSSMEVSRSEDH